MVDYNDTGMVPIPDKSEVKASENGGQGSDTLSVSPTSNLPTHVFVNPHLMFSIFSDWLELKWNTQGVWRERCKKNQIHWYTWLTLCHQNTRLEGKFFIYTGLDILSTLHLTVRKLANTVQIITAQKTWPRWFCMHRIFPQNAYAKIPCQIRFAFISQILDEMVNHFIVIILQPLFKKDHCISNLPWKLPVHILQSWFSL